MQYIQGISKIKEKFTGQQPLLLWQPALAFVSVDPCFCVCKVLLRVGMLALAGYGEQRHCLCFLTVLKNGFRSLLFRVLQFQFFCCR